MTGNHEFEARVGGAAYTPCAPFLAERVRLTVSRRAALCGIVSIPAMGAVTVAVAAPTVEQCADAFLAALKAKFGGDWAVLGAMIGGAGAPEGTKTMFLHGVHNDKQVQS